MPLKAHKAIGPWQNAGENLIWQGQPRQGIIFRFSDVIVIPASLIWCGLVIDWEYTALWHFPFYIALMGLPYLLLGIHLAEGRILVDALRRARTFYALTDKRVIIIRGIMKRKVVSLELRELDDIQLSTLVDGTGIIMFRESARPQFAQRAYRWFTGLGIGDEFERISDAKAVYGKIEAARRAAV